VIAQLKTLNQDCLKVKLQDKIVDLYFHFSILSRKQAGGASPRNYGRGEASLCQLELLQDLDFRAITDQDSGKRNSERFFRHSLHQLFGLLKFNSSFISESQNPIAWKHSLPLLSGTSIIQKPSLAQSGVVFM
jgi:hypothetical protein